MDCLAVSVSFGATARLRWPEIFKIAGFFGFFQGIMPLFGWFIGDSFSYLIRDFDHWIALGILSFIGIRMIFQAFSKSQKKPVDIRNTMILLGLSVATSIDALMTGVSLGFIHVNILYPVAVIGIITFAVTVVGARMGARVRFFNASWAEFAGGVMLILIGLKIVADHLEWF